MLAATNLNPLQNSHAMAVASIYAMNVGAVLEIMLDCCVNCDAKSDQQNQITVVPYANVTSRAYKVTAVDPRPGSAITTIALVCSVVGCAASVI